MSKVITVSGQKVLNPYRLFADAQRIGAPTDFWTLANSASVPIGVEPGSAWLLVSSASMAALDVNAAHTVIFGDLVDGQQATVTLADWTIYRAIMVGMNGDGKAPYLVELRDKRQLLKLSTVNRQYNVRLLDCSEEGSEFQEDTLNPEGEGDPDEWTWQELFADLWGELPTSVAGTAPTLPFTPTELPENLKFLGVPTIDAIKQVLELCVSTLVLTPTTGAFTVVQLGSTQAGLAAAKSAINNRRMQDWDPKQDVNRAVMPETIRVYFHTRGGDGTVHEEDVPTGVAGAVADTVLGVWSPYVVEVGSDGEPVDATAVTDTAEELAEALTDQIDVAGERSRVHYCGLRTSILPGSQVHRVTWRDYGDSAGLVTEVQSLPEYGCVRPLVEGPSENVRPPSTQVSVDSCCGSVAFRNDSGETIPPYSLMRITGRVKVDGKWYYTVAKPNTEFQRHVLVNDCREVANEAFGGGSWLDEADMVAVDSASASFGWGVGPKPGEWTGHRYYCGFLLIGSAEEFEYTKEGDEDSTTIYIAKARQFVVEQVLTKTTAELDKGDAVDCTVWVGSPEAATTMIVSSVRNKFANVGNGKFVMVGWSGELPYAQAAECT